MSCDDQENNNDVEVLNMIGVPVHIQTERIADSFARVSNEYTPLKTSDIDLSLATNTTPMPMITQEMIVQTMSKMKSKISTVAGDIPWKVIKKFAFDLSVPLQNIFNSAIRNGNCF